MVIGHKTGGAWGFPSLPAVAGGADHRLLWSAGAEADDKNDRLLHAAAERRKRQVCLETSVSCDFCLTDELIQP